MHGGMPVVLCMVMSPAHFWNAPLWLCGCRFFTVLSCVALQAAAAAAHSQGAAAASAADRRAAAAAAEAEQLREDLAGVRRSCAAAEVAAAEARRDADKMHQVHLLPVLLCGISPQPCRHRELAIYLTWKVAQEK